MTRQVMVSRTDTSYRTRFARHPGRDQVPTRLLAVTRIGTARRWPSPGKYAGTRIPMRPAGNEPWQVPEDRTHRQARTELHICAPYRTAIATRELTHIDGSRAPNTLERPGLTYALNQLRDGVAARLVVDKLEHLGRSAADLRPLLRWCATNDVDLVALDVGLDTTTHEGRLAAGYLLTMGKRERETRRPRAPRRKRPQPTVRRR